MGNGDHIVIPKSILKRFIGKDKKVMSLNLKSGKIKKDFPDSIFTESNYYFDDVDKYIKDKSETIIGNLYHSIKQNNNEFKIDDILNMKNVFVLQHFRNRSFIGNLGVQHPHLKNIFHNLALKSLINSYLDNAGGIDNNIDIELKEIYEYIENIYMDFTPGFLLLKNTERTLVLPSSQFCFLTYKGYKTYLYTIAPDVALTWVNYPQKKEFEYAETNEDNTVEKLNSLIIAEELEDNTDNMIFGLEDELERISNKLK